MRRRLVRVRQMPGGNSYFGLGAGDDTQPRVNHAQEGSIERGVVPEDVLDLLSGQLEDHQIIEGGLASQAGERGDNIPGQRVMNRRHRLNPGAELATGTESAAMALRAAMRGGAMAALAQDKD